MAEAKELQGQGGQTASRTLTSRLVRGILEGEFRSGEKLPTERELAERYSLSRHVVREALKRLEALRLLRIQQGSGAYVTDVGITGGLELIEYLLFDHGGGLDFELLSDFVEFWTNFARDVVKLAAEHRTQEDVDAMRENLREREGALEDMERFVKVSQQMFHLLARATRNRMYQMLFNNLGRILVQIRARIPLTQFAPAITQESLERLVDAIEQRDGEMAALLVVRQIDSVREGVRFFLGIKKAKS